MSDKYHYILWMNSDTTVKEVLIDGISIKIVLNSLANIKLFDGEIFDEATKWRPNTVLN